MARTQVGTLNHTRKTVSAVATGRPLGVIAAPQKESRLMTVVSRGALLGLLLGLLAALVVTAGVHSPVVSLAYGVHWAAAVAIAGGWVAAMFFAGREGCCGNA